MTETIYFSWKQWREALRDTPMENLNAIKRFMKGDLCRGRGSRQRKLGKSRFCNVFKVSQYGRELATQYFAKSLQSDSKLCGDFWCLSVLRLTSHVSPRTRKGLSWRQYYPRIQGTFPRCIRPRCVNNAAHFGGPQLSFQRVCHLREQADVVLASR